MSIKSFSSFVLESHSIMEGGSAIKTSRRIRESEVSKTLKSIEEKLFPLMGLSPDDIGNDFIYIGSIGKKKNPDDTSGDIDIIITHPNTSMNYLSRIIKEFKKHN